MPGVKDLTNIWKNIKEFELQPIRDEAQLPLRIALVGAAGSGRHTLASQMRSDPEKSEIQTRSPLPLFDLEHIESVSKVDLIIMIVNASANDLARERQLVFQWTDAGKKVVVFVNQKEELGERFIMDQWAHWDAANILYGSALNSGYLVEHFVPLILRLLPDRHLALGRNFPIFRIPIARQLINDTCFSNAAYAFSTGLAATVPVLDLPLNITDMIILTKSQAFLVYRLGLLLGFSSRWQDYLGEFGSVIGGGFLWRQLARMLVGLIPVWGILPKVSVAYAGTFVVGHTVLQWYLTGRHLSPKQINALYRQAFTRGKEYARKLLARVPKPRLPKRNKAINVLPTQNKETIEQPVELSITTDVLVEDESAELEENSQVPSFQVCGKCGRENAADARFCQYCGRRVRN
jgi:uncharacterized protein (DUF697 family)